MSLNPILPLPVLVVVFAVLAAFVVWQLVLRENRGRRLAWALRAVMVVLVLVIALRPGIPGENGREAISDVDVFFVVDTTTSIVAEDWNGSAPRLDGVKADIADLVEAYPGATFALLSFDSSAVLRVPLTSDATAIANAAEVLAPEITVYSAGSSITEASGLLASTLQRASDAEPDRARIVYYFGDGEQTSSEPVDDFDDSTALVDDGFVLGYGTEGGGPMRVQTGYYDDDKTDDGYVQDGDGVEARSVIDEKNLGLLADQLGVDYVHRTASEDAPVATVSGGVSSETGGDPARGTIELYWIAAAALFVLVALEASRIVLRLREIQAAARRSEPTP